MPSPPSGVFLCGSYYRLGHQSCSCPLGLSFCLLLSILVLDHPSHSTTLGSDLGLVRGFDALDAGSIYSKPGHLIRYEVPRTKAKTGIRVGHLVRECEDNSSSSRYAVILGLGTFEEIPTEAKAWIGVSDIQLFITKLSGEPTRHIRLYRANFPLPKHQVPEPDVYQPLEDAGR